MKSCVRISLLFILLAVTSSSAKPSNGKFTVQGISRQNTVDFSMKLMGFYIKLEGDAQNLPLS